jgi:mycofactocin glycosyltransferase
MGPDGGLVAPGLPTHYMPSTVVVVRRSAIGAGFDESLHIGEDVGLVWRLSLAGWLLRYERSRSSGIAEQRSARPSSKRS